MKNTARAQGTFSYKTIERALERRATDKEARNKYTRNRPTWKQIVAILEDGVLEGWAEVKTPGAHNRATVYRWRDENGAEERH